MVFAVGQRLTGLGLGEYAPFHNVLLQERHLLRPLLKRRLPVAFVLRQRHAGGQWDRARLHALTFLVERLSKLLSLRLTLLCERDRLGGIAWLIALPPEFRECKLPRPKAAIVLPAPPRLPWLADQEQRGPRPSE